MKNDIIDSKDYLDSLNERHFDIIKDIHNKAINDNVPIIKDEGMDVILSIIKILKPIRILEIGTAVAFSSILFALYSDANIDTIERNEQMYQKALENIKKFNFCDRIKVHFIDALNIDLATLNKEYDLIFIDAAKAQYQKYFQLFSPLLKKNGVIITDNILFHGLVQKYTKNELNDVSKDLKALVRKIDNFNNWLKNNDDFETIFLNCGDGLAVSVRK